MGHHSLCNPPGEERCMIWRYETTASPVGVRLDCVRSAGRSIGWLARVWCDADGHTSGTHSCQQLRQGPHRLCCAIGIRLGWKRLPAKSANSQSKAQCDRVRLSGRRFFLDLLHGGVAIPPGATVPLEYPADPTLIVMPTGLASTPPGTVSVVLDALIFCG
jgi:hypothetical protein